MDGTDCGFNSFLFLVDGFHLGHAVEKVFPSLKNAPERKGYIAGLKTGRGHLIDKGRKLVIVVFVDQHNLIVGVPQAHGELQSAYSAAYNDDTRLFVLPDVCSHLSVSFLDIMPYLLFLQSYGFQMTLQNMGQDTVSDTFLFRAALKIIPCSVKNYSVWHEIIHRLV